MIQAAKFGHQSSELTGACYIQIPSAQLWGREVDSYPC